MKREQYWKLRSKGFLQFLGSGLFCFPTGDANLAGFILQNISHEKVFYFLICELWRLLYKKLPVEPLIPHILCLGTRTTQQIRTMAGGIINIEFEDYLRALGIISDSPQGALPPSH